MKAAAAAAAAKEAAKEAENDSRDFLHTLDTTSFFFFFLSRHECIMLNLLG